MSTKLTRSPKAGYELAESRSLRLVFQLDAFRDRMLAWLLQHLRDDGFPALTSKHLTFMGELDCGTNHASELARRLAVSRQAIHKSVAELTAIGWLETTQNPDLGNQKVIEFTAEGERLMARARHYFALLDGSLEDRFGSEMLDRLSDLLESDALSPAP
ncbi:MAG: MarR family winged helix-turn-helix transcriptional regulator [Pseudomonadota bacterium]